jgi:hypothetical protein
MAVVRRDKPTSRQLRWRSHNQVIVVYYYEKATHMPMAFS